MILILLVAAAVVAITYPTAACPVIFYIQNENVGPSIADYGIFFLRNRTQVSNRFQVPRKGREYYCSTLIGIVSDSVAEKSPQIASWIDHECARLESTECQVEDLTGGQYHPPTPQPRVPSVSPTTHPTLTPTRIQTCRDEVHKLKCVAHQGCHWFGTLIGCQEAEFCGLETIGACLSRSMYCRWRGNRCAHK